MLDLMASPPHEHAYTGSRASRIQRETELLYLDPNGTVLARREQR
jgi:hypothetical protein